MNKSSYFILGLLGKEPMSGYDIKQTMNKIGRFYCSESNAQIYPILKKLEKQQLVKSKLDKSSGARQRRIYSLTTQGREMLLQWLPLECDLAMYREDILTKLAFAQLMDTDEIRSMLENYREQLEIKLDERDAIVAHIEVDHVDKLDQPYLFMVYDHVKRILETKIAWVDDTLEKLK